MRTMIRVIHKHVFEIKSSFELKLALGAEILFVDKQKKTSGYGPGTTTSIVTCLWEQHDPREERTETRQFVIIGTGHDFDSLGKKYIGSVMIEEYVWHCFESIQLAKDGETQERKL